MMLRVAAILALLLVAGCNGPATKDADPAPNVAPAHPAPEYTVTVVVTQETPDGAPLQAKVQGVPVNADGSLAPMQVVGTDTQGAARFKFRAPTTLLVRAVGPDGWTQEGARVHVDQAVAAEGVTVSDRDVFLPLFRSSLDFALGHTWSTATPALQADGELAPAVAFVPLALAEGLQAAYLSRLDGARVEATWTDGVDGSALSVSAGLGWNGRVWVEGNASTPSTGERAATWDGDLPADRPADLAGATLQAALLTRTGIVGDVAFDLRAELDFGGDVPAGMPADDCHLLC